MSDITHPTIKGMFLPFPPTIFIILHLDLQPLHGRPANYPALLCQATIGFNGSILELSR